MVLGRVTIEALPDDVLLDIFEFYMSEPDLLPLWYQRQKCQWYPLVHVCQRWRYLVFASPRRLDLCIYCTDSTRVREKLEIWPPFPIKIFSESLNPGDNIIAALEHPGRVRQIWLCIIHSPLDRLVAMMQESFPQLEFLHITVDLPHVCDQSIWIAFHFRHYLDFSCLVTTLLILPFRGYPILVTFHPRRWPHPFPP
ncbi:hypothetical protein BGW80DRAFT_179481 [Lactifluus volemus]|nr:hypothetical protein BGW80DRAFT_179481 [Lactifluus volemus]